MYTLQIQYNMSNNLQTSPHLDSTSHNNTNMLNTDIKDMLIQESSKQDFVKSSDIIIRDEESEIQNNPLTKKKTVVFSDTSSVGEFKSYTLSGNNKQPSQTVTNQETKNKLQKQDSLERIIEKYTQKESNEPQINPFRKEQPTKKHQGRSYSPRETVKFSDPSPNGGKEKPSFNFDAYRPVNPYGNNFRQQEYLEEFLSASKQNKSYLKKNLMELIFTQLLNRVQHEFPTLPSLYQDNIQKWSVMMLKSKQFQEVIGEYTQRIQGLIEREVTQNREKMSLYLTHPRVFKERVPQGIKISKDVKLNEIGSLTRSETEKSKKKPFNTTNSTSINQMKAQQQLTPGSNSNDPENFTNGVSSSALPASTTPTSNKKKSSFIKKEMTKKEREEKERQELSFLHQEYKKIMDKVKSIDLIADQMNEQQDIMSQDVMAFEHDAIQLENQVRDMEPLQKITDMLERWSSEPIHTYDEIQKFASELWVSLAEYEKDIKEGVQGHQIIIAMKEHKYMSHIEWIKNKFGFYVELYEQAFTELKLRQRKEVDRLHMSLCELESRLMNYQMDDSKAARLVNEEVPKFQKVQDANDYILELKRTLSTLYYENKQLQIFNQDLQNQVSTLEKCKQDLTENIAQWQHLFSYYQSMCVKKAKELGILDAQLKFDLNDTLTPLQQQEQNKKIKNIDKHKGKLDLSVQEDIVKTFEEILKFNQVMQETTQHYKLYSVQIRTIFQDLVRLGVIPAMRVKAQKTVFDQQTTTLSIQDQDRYDLFEIFDDLQKQTNQNFSQQHQFAVKPLAKKANEPTIKSQNDHKQTAIKQHGSNNPTTSVHDQQKKAVTTSNINNNTSGSHQKTDQKTNHAGDGHTSPPVNQNNSSAHHTTNTQQKQHQKKDSVVAASDQNKQNTQNQGTNGKSKKIVQGKVINKKNIRRGSNQSMMIKNDNETGLQSAMMIQDADKIDNKLVHAKLVADVEEQQFIEQKYNLQQFDDDLSNKEGLHELIKLDEQQRFELQIFIEQCLGKDIQKYTEQMENNNSSNSTFESLMKCESVEDYVNKLNKIIKSGLQRELNRREKLRDEKSKGSTPQHDEANQDLLDEEELRRRKKSLEEKEKKKKLEAEKRKNRVPLGDCIQFEYDENKTELLGFTLRPKLVQYMFFRDSCEIASIRETLRVMLYLNRLLQSYSVQLNEVPPDIEMINETFLQKAITPMKKHKQPLFEHYPQHQQDYLCEEGGNLTESEADNLTARGDSRQNTLMNRLQKVHRKLTSGLTIPSVKTEEKLEKPIIPKVQKAEKGTNVRPRQLLKVQGIDSQGLVNMLKTHVIDISCRISPYMKEKLQTLLYSDTMSGDDCQPALASFALKGIHYVQNENLELENTAEICFGDYLKLILDTVYRRIKHVPPFKRKHIDLKYILDSLFEAPTNIGSEKDYMAAVRDKTKVSSPIHGDVNPLKRATYYSTQMSSKEQGKFGIPDSSRGVNTGTGVFSLTQASLEAPQAALIHEQSLDDSLFNTQFVALPSTQFSVTTAQKSLTRNFVNQQTLEDQLFPQNNYISTQIGYRNSQQNWLSNTFSSQQHQQKPKTAAIKPEKVNQKSNFFTSGITQVTKDAIGKLDEPSVLLSSEQNQETSITSNNDKNHSRNFTQYILDKSSITHRVGGRQVNLTHNLQLTLGNTSREQSIETKQPTSSSSHMDRRKRRQQSQQTQLLLKGNPVQVPQLVVALDQQISQNSQQRRLRNEKQYNSLLMSHSLTSATGEKRDKNNPMSISEDTEQLSSSRVGTASINIKLDSKFTNMKSIASGQEGPKVMFEIPGTKMILESRDSKENEK